MYREDIMDKLMNDRIELLRNFEINKQKVQKRYLNVEIDFDKIIDFARLCPSGDNSQPWKFEVRENCLIVTNDNQRSNHVLNYKEVASLYSFGMMSEIIQIAANDQGFYANVKCTDFKNPTLEIIFTAGALRDELVDQISRREVDRREYKGGSLKDKVFQEIFLMSFHYPNVEVSYADNENIDVKKYIEKNDYKFAYWKTGFMQTLRWMKFSKEDLEQRDGLPWRNLGLKFIDMLILKTMRKFNPIYDFMSALKMWAPAKLVARRQVNSAAGFILISLKDYKDETVFNAGRFFMRAWLKLTEVDYKVQPHTAGSLPMYYLSRFEEFFDFIPSNMAKHYWNQRGVLNKIFRSKGYPFFLLRVGKNNQLPQNMKAPRLNIEEIKG